MYNVKIDLSRLYRLLFTTKDRLNAPQRNTDDWLVWHYKALQGTFKCVFLGGFRSDHGQHSEFSVLVTEQPDQLMSHTVLLGV